MKLFRPTIPDYPGSPSTPDPLCSRAGWA
jgi:hypothetical protein